MCVYIYIIIYFNIAIIIITIKMKSLSFFNHNAFMHYYKFINIIIFLLLIFQNHVLSIL